MVTEQLINYIKQQLEAGINKEEIKNILLANNWREEDINETFANIEKSNQSIPQSAQEGDAQRQNKSNKGVKVIIFIVIALTLIVTSVFGYFYYFKSPQKIIEGMLKNMMEVKSLNYVGQISSQVETVEQNNEAREKQEGDFSLSINGAFDVNDFNNLKLLSIISVSSSFFEGKAGLETRAVDNMYYFKVNSIPELPIAIDLSFLENQWTKFDLNEIKNYARESGLDKEVAEFEKQQVISNEKMEQVKDAIKKANIYIVVETSNSEINGKPAYRYKFTLSKENLINLFLEINRIMESPSFTDEEINSALKEIEMPIGEIWIGKEDLLLYRIIANLNFSDPKLGIKTKTEIVFDFNNHNKEVKVDIPSSTKTFEEVVKELMSATLDEEALVAADARIKLLLGQIKSQMEYLRSENFISTYISNPFLDIVIKRNSDEIISLNKDHNFAIYSNGSKWCVKVSLNTNGDWCVDSTGYFGIMQNCTDSSFLCK